VRATSTNCWGLELLTVEVLCPLVAPDSPVAHRTVRCVLSLQADFCIVHCSLVSAVGHWAKLTIAPLAYRKVWWLTGQSGELQRIDSKKTQEWPVREVLRPGHRIVSGAPLAAPIFVFAPNFVEFPTHFLCWFMLNFMYLR
jgi:hypothetical protein